MKDTKTFLNMKNKGYLSIEKIVEKNVENYFTIIFRPYNLFINYG